MTKVMKCRLCGRKYMFYGMEVRLDASVCRTCEAEAKEEVRQRDDWAQQRGPGRWEFS